MNVGDAGPLNIVANFKCMVGAKCPLVGARLDSKHNLIVQSILVEDSGHGDDDSDSSHKLDSLA